jgi:hypothetical protein
MLAANASATDLAPSTTIAGHAFAVKERNGGILALRIALAGSTMAELALRLTCLDQVRVTRGPEGLGRGRCYLAHCPGFKMVLSLDEGGEVVLGLVSRTPGETVAPPTSALGALLASLMEPPSVGVTSLSRQAFKLDQRAREEAPRQAGAVNGLRRASLAAGKPPARKAPLVRKTPLGQRKVKK